MSIPAERYNLPAPTIKEADYARLSGDVFACPTPHFAAGSFLSQIQEFEGQTVFAPPGPYFAHGYVKSSLGASGGDGGGGSGSTRPRVGWLWPRT